jgi:uncharacterized membrane protein (UPF0136 family)
MTRSRLDGLYLLLIGSLVFLLLGIALENAAPVSMVDFRVIYYPARCLVQQADPYQQSAVLNLYRAEGGASSSDSEKIRQIVTRHIYLPTAFSFTIPFAMLPWGPAHVLWMALTMGSLIFASFLIWNLAADSAPIVSGALIGFCLANSELLVITGNAAGIAISLCMVAVWCFLRERFIPVGILCFAISLGIKPQDTGFVWLYFLLAGGVYRKRALQTLFAAVAFSLPAILWVWRVAPHWMQEWNSNVLALSRHGGISDPGLASTGGHGLDMLISLQTVTSVFWDDPRIYNLVTWLICAPLLLLLAFAALRFRPSTRSAWLALAAIAALSMLPVYHRQIDARLLLLAVPACALLRAEGGRVGRLALVVTSAGIVSTSDLPWAILLALIGKLHLPATGLSTQMVMALQVLPVPLLLLLMGAFYLWIFVSRASAPALPAGSPEQTPLVPALFKVPHALKKSFRSTILSLCAKTCAVRGPE